MRSAFLIGVILLLGCSAGVYNYVQPQGPRYAGVPSREAPRATADTLRVVSFNIAWSEQIDSALVALQSHAVLADADVILLQEMDAPGVQRLAGVLGMHYVFYPATLHPKTARDFGNAVLSRWPIVADAKIVLPHMAWFRGTQRAATAATIRVGADSVRVYSAHLGTLAEIGFGARRDQLRAILADAALHPHVILGGDMNEPWLGGVARDTGYDWPTEDGPRTALIGRVDHIFLRGLSATGSGTVFDNHAASDHRPVWVKAVWTLAN
ncbi:MAG TPA: endonuclease/exonuclease/phosphatase family protein [Longimicrobiales bacterium]|nr:endonuclease/exonuclease/phosphatase family protein [Longimicrobiales bacterium]